MNLAAREYMIGPHRIVLPADHKLDQYQHTWRKYDKALGEIARILHEKYPGFPAIDIGANIGDSAALICKYASVPVLCIEGNESFFPFLQENARRLGKHIEIEQSYIGTDTGKIDAARVNEARGTASVVNALSAEGEGSGIKTKSLDTIIGQHRNFQNPRLIKSDTDGLDFLIIRNSLDVLRKLKPVLFFEYDTSFSADGEEESIATIESLLEIGYHHFVVYDNFGNFLISANKIERFQELNSFLRSHLRYGRAIYYFDVCALTDQDLDVYSRIRAHEIA